MSRVKNSVKNIKYGVVGQILSLVVSFVARMVFVSTLGSEYLGLHGLFTNVLSILLFAELGIGAAIAFSLYKPLSEQNIPKIKVLMRLFKRAYITIGIIIATLGLSIAPFLSFLVKDMPNIPHIHLIYLMFVTNSAISYFFSYKRSLIIADQKRYIATYYRYGFFIILNILQSIFLITTKNYLLFLVLQILFTFIENLIVSRKADKLYPYLKEKTSENLDGDTKKTIVRNVKAMMIHKIGGIVVNGTDNLLISKFVGLISVGIYSNYLLVITALNSIFGMIFQGVTASIGNLGATQSEEKSLFIFKCLNFIGFWIYGFATICLINLINPLISIWLGEEYLFSVSLVMVITVNFYLTGMRLSVLTFRDALGLYWNDRYKPLFESSINLVASIILVKKFGIVGVFIGTTISTLSTCFWVEPYVLFKYGLKSSTVSYFIRYIINTLILLLGASLTWLICSFIDGFTILSFSLKLLVCIVVPNVIFTLVFRRTEEFNYLISVLKSTLKRN